MTVNSSLMLIAIVNNKRDLHIALQPFATAVEQGPFGGAEILHRLDPRIDQCLEIKLAGRKLRSCFSFRISKPGDLIGKSPGDLYGRGKIRQERGLVPGDFPAAVPETGPGKIELVTEHSDRRRHSQ